MRVASYPRTKSVRFNMTPMIDVVFLLIIFFLVSSTLAKQESRVDLELPTAASGLDAVEDERRSVVINVRPSGEIQLAGDIVEPRELARRLRYERETSGELEVRIRADRRVPYRFVEPILLACARAGVWKITFKVYRKEK